MKILQLNTWSCSIAPAIADLFEREQPDIVCLQEVIRAEVTGKILQSFEEILADYPFEYVYYSPLAEFRFMHGTAQRGNMILSKYPISKSETFWTHGEFQPDFDYSMGWNAARGVAHVTCDTLNGPVEILTTHGYHVKEHKNGNEETLKACRQIVDYIKDLSNPVILAGDFNLVPESESIKVINEELRNLCLEQHIPTTRNHLTTKKETCDYIFVSRDLPVEKFVVLDDIVSDHKALVAVI